MKLGLTIPLLNEADSVTEVVASTHSILSEAGIDHILVLVNNGSQDQSREVIESLVVPGMIEAVHLRENVGYGGGILTGLAHLERQGFPEVIGWAWGDGQVSATAIPPLFQAIESGADVAKALRTERHDGPWRQAVTAGYSVTMRTLGVRTRDINGCPKLMTREAFNAIQPASADWFLDAELVLAAERMGMRIEHHPVTMRRREHGKSNVKARTLAEFGKNIIAWRLGL